MQRRALGAFFFLLIGLASTGCDGVPTTCGDELCGSEPTATAAPDATDNTAPRAGNVVSSGLQVTAAHKAVRANLSHVPYARY